MRLITDPGAVDRASWSQFVYDHPHGNVFQIPEMYDVFCATENYEPHAVFIVDEKNALRGVLLAVIIREIRGPAGLLSARSVVLGGPLLGDLSDEHIWMLIEGYNNKVQKKAVITQIRNFYTRDDISGILINAGFSFREHLNIILNLKAGEQYLWDKFSRSRKKGIRRALDSNFNFAFGQDKESIRQFYELLAATYKRIKLPFPSLYHFERISEFFSPGGFMVFNISGNNKTVVSLFTLIYKKTMYGYYMGSAGDKEAMKEKPADLLFWEVFRWAIGRGIEYFDWMGAGSPSKKYGVRDFKLEYGGGAVNFGRFEKIHKPMVYNISRAGLRVWQALK